MMILRLISLRLTPLFTIAVLTVGVGGGSHAAAKFEDSMARRTLARSANLVQLVINGGFPPATANNLRPLGITPYKLVLDDSDVAAVLTHIRRTWGNSAAQVTELEVIRVRGGGRP